MKLVKIIFALMLFLCLVNLPYGYYQLVRFLGMVLLGYLAYTNFQNQDSVRAFVFVILAILFQPLFKISLGRTLWNVIDIIVGVGLLVDAFSYPKYGK